MARSYRCVDRDQQFLLPPDMADWLPQGHLVWFVLEVVDQLDTAEFHRRHPQSGPGRAAYDPEMLLALLVYAYAVGERSSRRIEQLCTDHVAFRVLCAQDAPDHTTIARFRAVHEDAFADLFTQVLMLCAQAGMGRVGIVSVDGTKIAADAAVGANRSEAWLQEEARRVLAEAGAVDAVEDERFGDARGDELPRELADPRTRTERIRAALKQVQDKQAQAEDAEARRVVKAEEYVAAVEAGQVLRTRPPVGVDRLRLARARVRRDQARLQEATDAGERKSLATSVGRARRDLAAEQARQALAEAEASARRRRPGRSGLADPAEEEARAGRKTRRERAAKPPQANITDPDSRMLPTARGFVQGFNAQIAVSDDHLILATRLTQDPGDSTWFTPMMDAAVQAARTMSAARTDQPPEESEAAASRTPETLQPNTVEADVGETQAQRWPIGTVLADAGYLSSANLTAPGPDRLIALGTGHRLHQAAKTHPAAGPPPPHASPVEQMQHRLRTPEGEHTYKRRGATVEAVIGHLKDQTGLRRFSRRGMKAAASELELAATVLNILKLHSRVTPALS